MPVDQPPSGGIRARRPTPADGRVPARLGRATTPVHRGRDLDFAESPGRDYWWDQLDPELRERLLRQAGDIIDWWACGDADQPDRPLAVVFGWQAFAVSEPTITSRGGPVDRLFVWPLLEASHRFARVADVADSDASVGALRRPEPGAQTAAATPAGLSLPEHVRGFLGNLPPEAQRRLQQPFVAGDLVRESDYYYYGYPEQFDFWCYLAGSRTVTFASGKALLVPGRRRALSWDLLCRQVDVAGGGPDGRAVSEHR